MIAHHINYNDILNSIIEIFPLRNNGFYTLITAFLPTIIAISYPIIIQTITKLNEIYSSTLIINAFKKEKQHIWFKNCLIISLILSAFTFLNYEAINIIAFFFIIILIVVFIKYIELILIYNNPKELNEHYLRKINIKNINIDNIIIDNLEERYKYTIKNFHEIFCDLYCYSIKLDDNTLEANIREKYFYLLSHMGKFIDNKKYDKTTFDPIIYNSNFRILENFIKYENKQTRYKHIELFTTDYYLPTTLRSNGPTPFDSQTFLAIWNNLILLVKSGDYGKLKAHWKSIHNYYFFYLKRSYLEYDNNSKVTKESNEKNNIISKFRENIREFNISFLGLIYYKSKYKLIDELVLYTQNQPPKTFLQEFNAQSLFEFYLKSRNEFVFEKWVIQYYFDDLEFDSIGFQKDSKYYISEICLILFLYCWVEDYGTSLKSKIQGMKIPEDLPTKKKYKTEIPYIINRIIKILSNKELINNTSLSLISRRACILKDIKHPIDYLLDYKKQLETTYEERLSHGQLDQQKINDLKQFTIGEITQAFNNISRIKGNDLNKGNRDMISQHMETIRGTVAPLNREAFLTDPTIHFVDYDKVIGRYIKANYYAHLVDKLQLLTDVTYKVEFTKIFEALERLNLNDHLIISANLNLEYLNKYLSAGLVKQEGENETYIYKGIPIYSFDGGSDRTGKFYILRNSDKPMIKHKDWKEIENSTTEFVTRWKKMEEISKELHIYFEMIDLASNPESLQEFQKNSQYNSNELSNMVLFDFDFLGYCWFPKNVKIVSISQGDHFQQGGTLNDLNDIHPL